MAKSKGGGGRTGGGASAPMPESATAPRKVLAVERREKAVEMRKAGALFMRAIAKHIRANILAS